MRVEEPGARFGHPQLIDVHRTRLRAVDWVEEVLLLLVECDDRAQNQQLDAAAFEQVDLVGLRQRFECSDLHHKTQVAATMPFLHCCHHKN